jgi:hypothetical protein
VNKLARSLGLGVAGALACGPILGLDEYRPRTKGSIEAPSPGDAGDAGDAGPACTSNAHCIDASAGAPSLCVSGACVAVDQSVCLPTVLPSNDALKSESVTLFAAFIPLNGAAPLAQPVALSYALALKELASAGGIPGPPHRDVAMIFCDSTTDLVERGVEHVVRELRLPAMIAGFPIPLMPKLVLDKAVPGKTFTLNPSVVPEGLKYGNVDRMLWNLLGTAEDVALAYRPLVDRVVAYLGDLGRPLRLALVATKSPTEAGIATVVQNGPLDPLDGSRDIAKAVRFNGKSTAENGSDFLLVSFDGLEDGATPDYAGIASKLAAFEPDIVLAATREEIIEIASGLEGRLRADSGTPRLPMWLLGPRNASSALNYIADSTGIDPKTHERFVGLQYASANDLTEKGAWLARMAVAYPEVDPSRYAATENFYDAVYWLAYGLAAAGPGAPVNGESIRDGVRNLLATRTIHPGEPDVVSHAFRQIAVGGASFVGTLGPPDINTAFGTWNSVGSLYCYEKSGSALAIKYDALRLAPGGSFPSTGDALANCFSGF